MELPAPLRKVSRPFGRSVPPVRRSSWSLHLVCRVPLRRIPCHRCHAPAKSSMADDDQPERLEVEHITLPQRNSLSNRVNWDQTISSGEYEHRMYSDDVKSKSTLAFSGRVFFSRASHVSNFCSVVRTPPLPPLPRFRFGRGQTSLCPRQSPRPPCAESRGPGEVARPTNRGARYSSADFGRGQSWRWSKL